MLRNATRRTQALLTLALAGGLLAACGNEATAEPEDPWAAAMARAEAATFLVFEDDMGASSSNEEYWPVTVMAFYIGNDEWITVGDLEWWKDYQDEEYQYTIRQGESYGGPVRHDLRPVRQIGYDAATGIGLLAAPGDGVPPLRWAAAIPPPCTPVRLAGYWYAWSEEGVLESLENRMAPRTAWDFPDPAACDPAVPPPLTVDPGWGSDVLPGGDYFVPSSVGAALGGVVTDAGMPLLRMHRSDKWNDVSYDLSAWTGAPLVTATGDVVGVLSSKFRNQAVPAPAVLEALDRIRADAEDNEH